MVRRLSVAFEDEEYALVEKWFEGVKTRAGDSLTQREILLLYANDKSLWPKGK